MPIKLGHKAIWNEQFPIGQSSLSVLSLTRSFADCELNEW